MRGRFLPAAAIAAVAGLAISAGVPAPASGAPAPGWPQPRYGAARTGYDPGETQLGTGNVGRLVTRATAPLGRPYSAAPPVVADGLVFVTSYFSTGGQPGEIEAFPQTCGAPHGLSCRPVWKAFVSSDDSMGVTVADGQVFANTIIPDYTNDTDSQKLWVFSEHCGTGGATCTPLWTTTIPGQSFADEAPTVAGGTVYVPFGQVGHAYLYAFPVSCATGCRPLWRGTLVDGADDSAAVADGFVYVPDYDGNLYAFRTGCASAGKVCSPAWFGSVGEGGPPGAAAGGGLVFAGSQNGSLYAFKARGCGNAQFGCAPVWTATIRPGANILSDPAVAGGLVYITDYADGYLYAFPERCAAACKPAWKAFVGPKELSDPAVANGVVYVDLGGPPPRIFLPVPPSGPRAAGVRPDPRWLAPGHSVGIDAFSATCATGGGTCSPLWQGSGGSFYSPSGPVVAGGELWATGGPVRGPADLYAFGLPVPHQARGRY